MFLFQVIYIFKVFIRLSLSVNKLFLFLSILKYILIFLESMKHFLDYFEILFNFFTFLQEYNNISANYLFQFLFFQLKLHSIYNAKS